MTTLPSAEAILAQLPLLDVKTADDLESETLDFKRWEDAKKSLAAAVEAAVCFANAEGGVIVFGGRERTITGCERYDLDVWRRGIYERTRPNLTVDISELHVPEGTLLIVRVPRGPVPPYGTAAGLYQVRVGKNCMPYSPEDFQRRQAGLGVLDWSSQTIGGVGLDGLESMEIARLRNVLRANRPESPLLALKDDELLTAFGVIMDGEITHACLLLAGSAELLSRFIPNHEVIYLHHSTPTDLDFRLDRKTPLLHILESLTDAINVRNPFKTIKTGLFLVDIPAFPEPSFREAILNALIHRDYLEPGSVYIRHSSREMSISSPGGFIGGITVENVLHAEPRARNRLLAEVFQTEMRIRDRLEQYCHRGQPWLERRGRKSGVTYHLSRAVAAELVGKVVYSRSRAIDKVQWPALIRQYVAEHGSINNSECRDLLLLGNSRSAQSTVSRLLAGLDFLEGYGTSPKNWRYRLRKDDR